MTRIPIKIEEQDAEERMDIVLPELLENTSRSSIQKLIEKGNVLVNGVPVTSKKYKLKEGDLVEVQMKTPLLYKLNLKTFLFQLYMKMQICL